ncbi:Crp/Fnr family transcriptional regulator [Flavobacterium oreochromis]|uniref:Crp/Fnr family transcriptional regulator n=1 Tax=Flavobacterium oreochromis TaxID=2906078 RepID=UPI001CE63EFF|nr:cyclic nucleotide-binding domain-containing protein [Flavobacterium oreochromis]QYS85708.1 Crp/Fnr family transcriptional regulator [Flavobacterium oreochromis]
MKRKLIGGFLFEILPLKKSDFFIKQGHFSLQLGFIIKGMVKAYSVDTKGKENIYCFGIENDFITVLNSFQNRTVSTKNIQALEDTLLLTITLQNLNLLLQKSTNWEKLTHYIIQKEYLEKERFLQLFHHQSANLRFNNLMQFYPFYLHEQK